MNAILADAIRAGASDIHIEPQHAREWSCAIGWTACCAR